MGRGQTPSDLSDWTGPRNSASKRGSQSRKNLIIERNGRTDEEVIVLASEAAHKDWQKNWVEQHGSDETRFKETTDQDWINIKGANQVDIAHTDFKDLPQDWKDNNSQGAASAIEALRYQLWNSQSSVDAKKADQMTMKQLQNAGGAKIDLETAAEDVHTLWLQNNSWAKDGELDIPYRKLSEIEKQKDRDFILQAMEKAGLSQEVLLSDEERINPDKNTIAIAGEAAHKDWQKNWAEQHGPDETRLKKTVDQEWIKAHGTDQVDIAHTDFKDLPQDWQNENSFGAESAAVSIMDQLTNQVRTGPSANKEPESLSLSELQQAAENAGNGLINLEEASAEVHEDWLKRNDWAKDGELDVPYESLPEIEKKKDRDFVLQTIEAAGIILLKLK